MSGPGSVEPADRPGAGKADRWDRAALALVFLLAAAVRVTPWRRVFPGDGVVFTDGDSYYHMWRVWNAASGDLRLPQREPFANFPHGGEILWAPAFDWTVAVIVRWLGLDRSGAEVLCAWLPVVLGASAVAIAANLARRSFSRSAGWFTGGLLALLVGSFNYTQLGFFDHHAAVMLIGLLLLGGAMRVVATPPAGPRGWPLAAGALAAAALLTWSGSLLHCVVLQLALGVWALQADDRAVARVRAGKLALAQAIAAAAIWPVCGGLRWEVFGDFTPLALSPFQPVWLGAGAVCLMLSAALWRSEVFGGSRPRRVASSLTVAGIGGVLAFAAIPDLRATLDRSSGWFSGEVAFLGVIVELSPLLGVGDRPDWSSSLTLLTPLFFAYPVAAVALVWRGRRPDRWLLVYWSGVFFALTLSQTRFINTFAVCYAIVLGGGAARIADAAARWCGGRRSRVAGCAAVALAASYFLVEPTLQTYRRFVVPRSTDALTSAAAKELRWGPARAAARFLAQTAPPVLDADGVPTYAVLCNWGVGHEVRYRANLPMIQDGFGPYVSPEGVAAAGRYFRATGEDAALAELERTGARYVIVDFLGAGHHDRYGYRAMTSRMLRRHGSGGRAGPEGRFGQRRFLRALTRHRLIFHAPHRLIFHAPNGRTGLHVYEIVPGASVSGVARPGAIVTVTLPLRTASGESFEWLDRIRSDRSGRFELRLPYATRGGDFAQVAPVGSYTLASEGAQVSLDVPESAVRDGAEIAAPPLRLAAPESVRPTALSGPS